RLRPPPSPPLSPYTPPFRSVFAPFRPAHRAPDLLLGPSRRPHGAVHVLLGGHGHIGKHFLGGGVDGLHRLPARGFGELTVDEQAVGGDEIDDGPGDRRRCVFEARHGCVLTVLSRWSRSRGRSSGRG